MGCEMRGVADEPVPLSRLAASRKNRLEYASAFYTINDAKP
jgi:hypothetical protein